jgi:hypothetical protein
VVVLKPREKSPRNPLETGWVADPFWGLRRTEKRVTRVGYQSGNTRLPVLSPDTVATGLSLFVLVTVRPDTVATGLSVFVLATVRPDTVATGLSVFVLATVRPDTVATGLSVCVLATVRPDTVATGLSLFIYCPFSVLVSDGLQLG